MFDFLKKNAKYVTAVVAGLVAANGVLHVVDAGYVTQILALLSILGLYVVPSPVQK